MKKLLVFVLVLGVALAALRPYYAVSWDDWGFALRVRTTVHEKFEPLFVLPAK